MSFFFIVSFYGVCVGCCHAVWCVLEGERGDSRVSRVSCLCDSSGEVAYPLHSAAPAEPIVSLDDF